MRFYILVSYVIVPLVICLISNGLIYLHVRSSSRRLQTGTGSMESQPRQVVSRRDIYLLRHMVMMFCLFVSGWAPSAMSDVVGYFTKISSLVDWLITFWYQLVLVLGMVDLFLYNHELRGYLGQRCFGKCRQEANGVQNTIVPPRRVANRR